jgi:hypothetical protein
MATVTLATVALVTLRNMRLKNDGGVAKLACSGAGEECHGLHTPPGTDKHTVWAEAMGSCHRNQDMHIAPWCGLCIFCAYKRLLKLLQLKWTGNPSPTYPTSHNTYPTNHNPTCPRNIYTPKKLFVLIEAFGQVEGKEKTWFSSTESRFLFYHWHHWLVN